MAGFQHEQFYTDRQPPTGLASANGRRRHLAGDNRAWVGLIKAGPDRAGKRSESDDGCFIPLCPLDAGLSDRDRLGHRSIGLVMSTQNPVRGAARA